MASFKSVLVGAAVLTVVAAAPTMVKRQSASAVPQYVLDYAPLVWLDSTEIYNPGDLGSQLTNTSPAINNTVLPTDGSAYPTPLTLANMGSLDNVANGNGGNNIYLASKDDFTTIPSPSWLLGVKPDSNGVTQGAASCAVVVNQKANGTTDAFYMYFYNYNQGNTVLDQQLGDHVGDWEHNMVRFVNGKPTAIWYSQHGNGEAFSWSAFGLEFSGQRPYSYSANGTHANYATSGTHDHTIPDVPLPWGPLEDYTSRGTLWDPVASAYFYSVSFPAGQADGDSSNPSFAAADNGVDAGSAPTQAMDFRGQWGDDQLPSSDPRQKEFFGFYKFTAGPTGPQDKQLNRKDVCPSDGDLCIVRDLVTPGG